MTKVTTVDGDEEDGRETADWRRTDRDDRKQQHTMPLPAEG